MAGPLAGSFIFDTPCMGSSSRADRDAFALWRSRKLGRVTRRVMKVCSRQASQRHLAAVVGIPPTWRRIPRATAKHWCGIEDLAVDGCGEHPTVGVKVVGCRIPDAYGDARPKSVGGGADRPAGCASRQRN